MTMVLPEAAGAAEGAVGAGSSGGSGAAKKFGLTGSQKAGAIGAAVPQPRSHHPYILGLLLIVTGGMALVGSVTGTLPSMIAALFDPSILDDAGGNNANSGEGKQPSTGVAADLNASGVGVVKDVGGLSQAEHKLGVWGTIKAAL